MQIANVHPVKPRTKSRALARYCRDLALACLYPPALRPRRWSPPPKGCMPLPHVKLHLLDLPIRFVAGA
jgi:hypothetical protein